MIVLDNIICDQKTSISKTFDYLSKIEENKIGCFFVDGSNNPIKFYNSTYDKYEISIEVFTTQKSACIMLLYNFIESIVTKLIFEIHEALIRESINFFKLNEKIRNTIIVYYNNLIEKMNIHNSASHIQELFLLMMQQKKVTLNYDDLSQYYSLYSGNLDSREIKKVFKNSYGVNINDSELQETCLLTIKNGRNKLAHGEVTFEEYGRDLTMQQLIDLKNKVFMYIDALYQKIKYFLDNKLYLNSQM